MKRTLYISFIFILNLLFSSTVFAAKQYNELIVSPENITSYPKSKINGDQYTEITLGDIHGNALKLLYFLINTNVLDMSKEEYEQWIPVYQKKPEELGAEDLTLFRNIINKAKINNTIKIRLLGDDLCDRGMNDYYTLYIYKKLDEASVPFEVVLSNHGNFFLSAYERPEQSFSYNPYGEGKNVSTVQSMLNLGSILEKGLVDKKEVLEMIQNHYLKHLVFPGYNLNNKDHELTLFTHAPIDLTILSNLAKDLNIPFKSNNESELENSFKLINAKISSWIMNKSFTEHYKSLNEEHKKTNTESPIKLILWNRNYSILNREHHPKDSPYKISYVHGHDSMSNVFDLDTVFGKGSKHNQGPYAIVLTHL